MYKQIRNRWQLYMLLILPTAYIVIFHYIPMMGIQIAFKNYRVVDGFWNSPWVGLKYFEQFFQSPSFAVIIKNTLGISLYSLAIGFTFPILLALGLNEVRNMHFKKFVQMVTYAPYFISMVVVVGIIMQVLDPRIGIVNHLIQWLGGDPVNFMGQASMFKHIYVWSDVWQITGYSAIIYLAALSSVDPSLHEASVIDGASTFQKIRHVDLPCIKPTIVILLILSISAVMNVGYEKILLMQNSLNISSSEVISTYVYKVGLENANFSFATAIGLFNSIINCLILVIANYAARKVNDTSLW